MSDRLDAMSLFLTVVDTGSLSAASKQRDLPLTTVSRKISDLEAHLGARLFQRAGRGLAVTEAGLSYASACRRILEDVAEAEQTVSGEFAEPKGTLTITAPIVFGRLHILPVVTEFLKIHDKIDIRLLQSDRLADLVEEHIDIALRIGRLPDSSLLSRKVGAVGYAACASPVYLEARGNPSHPDELADHTCISFESIMSASNWQFRSGNEQVRAEVHSRLLVNTAEAAIAAAIDGLGITRVLSYQIAEAVSKGALVPVLAEFEDEPWPVSLVYTSRAAMPKKVRAFLDYAAPRIKERLSKHLPAARWA